MLPQTEVLTLAARLRLLKQCSLSSIPDTTQRSANVDDTTIYDALCAVYILLALLIIYTSFVPSCSLLPIRSVQNHEIGSQAIML